VDDTRLALTVGHERRGALGPVALRVRPEVTLRVRPGADACSVDPVAEAWWEVECGGDATARLRLDADAGWRARGLSSGVDVRATIAGELGDPDPQDLLFIGGRNTLPGHPLNAYAGTRAAVADLTAWHDLVPRLLRLRLLAAAGWAGPDDAAVPVLRSATPAPAEPWTPEATDGIEASVGAGLGFLDGLVRLDWVLRTDSGEGALLLSVDPRLWSFL
jgi:hypothetical protein